VIRGDVLWVDLDPVRGSEANKRRPCVVVSNDASNRAAATLTVVPCTSVVRDVYPFEVYLEGVLDVPSKAQAHQVRTVTKRRVVSRPIGHLDPVTLLQLDDALRLHLAL